MCVHILHRPNDVAWSLLTTLLTWLGAPAALPRMRVVHRQSLTMLKSNDMIVAQEFVNGAKAVQLASGDDGFTSTGKTGAGWKAALKAAFLPEGWPDSVSADYLGEPGWQASFRPWTGSTPQALTTSKLCTWQGSRGHRLLLPAAFQLWDTVQGLSSYVRGMLSSQAILVGVGVGKEVRTTTAPCTGDRSMSVRALWLVKCQQKTASMMASRPTSNRAGRAAR